MVWDVLCPAPTSPPGDGANPASLPEVALVRTGTDASLAFLARRWRARHHRADPALVLRRQPCDLLALVYLLNPAIARSISLVPWTSEQIDGNGYACVG